MSHQHDMYPKKIERYVGTFFESRWLTWKCSKPLCRFELKDYMKRLYD